MKKLSTNNKALKLTLPIILSVVGIAICIAFFEDNSLAMYLGISLILGVDVFYIYNTYNNTEDLFYDHDFLYLKKKDETRKIKLNRITRVKLTSDKQKILGFQYKKYVIDFFSNPGMIDSVEFWVSDINYQLSEFEKYLDYYSPKTKIEH